MHDFPPASIAPNGAQAPETLNAPWRALAQKMKHLNEQDLQENLIVDVDHIHVKAVSDVEADRHVVDPYLLTGFGGHYVPQPLDPDCVEVQDTIGWQGIAETTISTGEDVLWCVGQVAYFCSAQDVMQSVYPARVQFALEVDGTVFTESITGHSNTNVTAPYELYATDHTDKDYSEWDSRHVERLPDAVGLSGASKSVRVVWSVPVTEGTHTVRLVARRITRVYTPSLTKLNGSDAEIRRDVMVNATTLSLDNVFVTNRSLAVVRVGGWQGTVGLPEAEFAPEDYQDQDIVTENSLTTNRIIQAENALNGIKPGNVQRGALRHEHLPSITSDAHQETEISLATWMPVFDGFENTTGTHALINDNGGSGFDWSDGEGWCCIMADLDIHDLYETTQPASKEDKPGCFFVLGKLALSDGTSTYVLPGTEMYLSNDVFAYDNIDEASGAGSLPYTSKDERFRGAMGTMHDNLSLTWVGKVTDLPIQTFQEAYVLVTTHNGISGDGDVEVTVKRRNLSIFRCRR